MRYNRVGVPVRDKAYPAVDALRVLRYLSTPLNSGKIILTLSLICQIYIARQSNKPNTAGEQSPACVSQLSFPVSALEIALRLSLRMSV